MCTLEFIEKEWFRDFKTEREAEVYCGDHMKRRQAFWQELISPKRERCGWWKASLHESKRNDCIAVLDPWIRREGRKREIVEFGGPAQAEMIQLHFVAAQFVNQNWNWVNGTISGSPQLPANLRGPKGLLNDLIHEFGSGKMRPPVHKQSITGVLIDEGQYSQPGVVVMITLEAINGGNGSFYPTPAFALLDLYPEFQDGLENSLRMVRDTLGIWRDGYDVRWRIDRTDGRELSSTLKGGSAGAAFAFALAKLFAQEQNSSAVSP